jgi:hypothetical protein
VRVEADGIAGAGRILRGTACPSAKEITVSVYLMMMTTQ